jgi:competence protein ComEC
MSTRRATVLAAAVLALTTSASHVRALEAKGLDIYWIDVEGGAATLIVTPAGESVLVDTGWPGARDADRIRHAAQEAGITRIDHLVTTHWHQDHFGGVADLAGRLPIGRFYDHGFPPGNPPDIDPKLKASYLELTKGRSTVLRPGEEIPLRRAPNTPPLSLRVVTADGLVVGEVPGSAQTRPCDQPAHTSIPDDKSDNFRSAGFKLTFGGFDFLDVGDLTWNVEHKLACPRNLVGVVDVYQVTHHGAEDSNNPVVAAAVAPTVAVINNGPRKGGKPGAYRLLRQTASVPDVFQVHRNVETTPADNAPPEMVANDEEACAAEWIRLRVAPDAKSYAVEVHGKGTKRTYAVK